MGTVMFWGVRDVNKMVKAMYSHPGSPPATHAAHTPPHTWRIARRTHGSHSVAHAARTLPHTPGLHPATHTTRTPSHMCRKHPLFQNTVPAASLPDMSCTRVMVIPGRGQECVVQHGPAMAIAEYDERDNNW